jgi:cytochrome c oxidase subunit 2
MKTKDLAVIVVGIVVVAAAYILLSGNIMAPREEIQPTGEIKEFTITAQQWAFNPNLIEADLGDNIKIEIHGLDDGSGSGHGFSLSAFNVNELIRKDGSVVVEFFAGKSGSFTFSCSVPCGRGHGGMSGRLMIN